MKGIEYTEDIYDKEGENLLLRTYSNGRKEWYLDNKLHRKNGPAVEYLKGKDRDKRWYRHGKLHREDGPAWELYHELLELNVKMWFLNDKLHREDGPAIEKANGDKSWYLNGEELSESEWSKLTLMED